MVRLIDTKWHGKLSDVLNDMMWEAECSMNVFKDIEQLLQRQVVWRYKNLSAKLVFCVGIQVNLVQHYSLVEMVRHTTPTGYDRREIPSHIAIPTPKA